MRCLLRLALALAQVQYTACWYGVGAFTFGSGLGGGEASCPALPVILGALVTLADSELYIYFPLLGRVLRESEGRPAFHRFGKRTVVVADVPWVARCTEQFASRLYSMSYGFASMDVHSADPVDDVGASS